MHGGIKARIKHLKEAASQVAHDKPGRRFINYHKHRQQHLQEHPVISVLYYALGFLLVAAGFLFGFVPGAPGFFLGIPGLIIIAGRSKYLSTLMDKGEIGIRRLFRKLAGIRTK